MSQCDCNHGGRQHQGFWGRCLEQDCPCIQYNEDEEMQPWQMF